MAPNSFVYTHLRKRRSTPTSPVAPADKPDNAFNTLESPEAPASSPSRYERAPTERQKSSESFHVPSFAETSLDLSFDPNLSIPSRFSDEHKRHKPISPPERPRPSTSAAASRETDRPGKHFAAGLVFESPHETEPSHETGQNDRQASSPGESSAHSTRPPRAWREYSSSDNLPTSTHSPKTHEATLFTGKEDSRTISTPSLIAERGASEDAAGHKASSSRFGKGRLNLLNPMSLLARRRASQNQTGPDEVVSTPNLTVPPIPDDYDPRIRGKIVHDFSAPRPRRIQSYQGHSAENSPVNEPRPFEGTGRRASDLPGLGDTLAKRTGPLPQHSPLFKEHFDDDRQALQPGNKGYLHSLAASAALHSDLGPANMPAFAKNLPMSLPDKDKFKGHSRLSSSPVAEETAANPPPAVASEVETTGETEVVPSIAHPTRPPPPPPPPPPIPQALPLKDHRREQLLKHMTSTSSRFSFQLGGVDSAAQEKLLEEKHKLQTSLRKPVDEPEVDEDIQEDDYNDYDPDADDDLEERIPGINADPDESDETADDIVDIGIARSQKAITPETFHFTPASIILSPAMTNATFHPTPRDEMGQVIGFANTTDSPNLAQHVQAEQAVENGEASVKILTGLGISSIASPDLKDGSDLVLHLQPQSEDFDDDMYFDDGNFDDISAVEEGTGVDETIFDDESGKIWDIPAENAKKFKASQQLMASGLQKPSSDCSFPANDRTESLAAELKQVSFVEPPAGVPYGQTKPNRDLQPSDTDQPIPIQQGGLTEGNLAAYHDALVSAANEAAANGRFSRQTGSSQTSEDQGSSSQMRDSHPGLVSDDGRLDYDHLGGEEEETFPVDDDYGDDLMIAEANAEVLENDDEGFYGQEFGFYARAHARGNAEPVNGGYFGPPGADGIKRSHSAKANFQEPSLTPITERSEWSTRNSVASLQIPIGPYSAQSMPSPGIAQLIDLDSATFDDEDMTLGALMKLRRGAWGGSSTSVNSIGGSHGSNAPLAHPGSKDYSGSAIHMGNGQKLTSSVHSLTDSVGIPESEEEGEAEEKEVLTIMQNTPRKGSTDQHLLSMPLDHAVHSPVSVGSEKSKNHTLSHSRNSSGAESISYIKDPEGSGRWVLERRRTGDDGELEIVEREYLAGARI